MEFILKKMDFNIYFRVGKTPLFPTLKTHMHSLAFIYWVRPDNFNSSGISATRYLIFLKFSASMCYWPFIQKTSLNFTSQSHECGRKFMMFTGYERCDFIH